MKWFRKLIRDEGGWTAFLGGLASSAAGAGAAGAAGGAAAGGAAAGAGGAGGMASMMGGLMGKQGGGSPPPSTPPPAQQGGGSQVATPVANGIQAYGAPPQVPSSAPVAPISPSVWQQIQTTGNQIAQNHQGASQSSQQQRQLQEQMDLERLQKMRNQ